MTLLIITLALLGGAGAHAAGSVVQVDVTGVIGQGVQDYVQRGLRTAEKTGAGALLVTIDTPGGLLDSTKNICTQWQNSAMPVIVYVHPNGATATSAGFFLLMCSDVAAMAPDTSTGSAHPVSGQGEQMDETMSQKVTNFSVSYMETLTRRRGRNVKFAEQAIRSSKSITAQSALKQNVIEIVAPDIDSVLNNAHGMTFKKGRSMETVNTRNAQVTRLRMNVRESFLHKVGHPNIAYILFIVGLYALIFEVTHPGTFVSGIIGVSCLVTAFVAFSVLPVNYLGIMLILVGIGLLVAEIFIVSHGLLSLGGLALFVMGSLFLYNSGEVDMQLDPWLIAGVAGVTFVFIVIALAFVIKSLRSKVATGGEGMIGLHGKTRTPLSPEGNVFVHGELWNARTQDGSSVAQDARVEIVALEGMQLIVRPII